MSDDPFRVDLFAPLTGTSFRIDFTDGTIELRLDEVTPLPPPRMQSPGGAEPLPETVAVRRNPFTVLFTGPRSPQLPQHTYRMISSSFTEPLDIFIVPIGVGPEGYRYQAVFS